MNQDVDAYYGEDEAGTDALDLSFLDEDTEDMTKDAAKDTVKGSADKATTDNR